MASTTSPDGGPTGHFHEVSGERPVSGWSGPPPPMGEETDELIGETICNTYVIQRILGEGGMGRVYQAQHTRIASKRFAVKTLHPEFLRQKELVQRFGREAELAASISNPHVVGVYDVDKLPDGRPFMVAEYLEGEEFGDLLDRAGKLPVERAIPIVRQVCKALGAAHDKGVVHRDVKPENVFLIGKSDRPLAKVLDFGISRLDDSSNTALTKTGMVMGTPAYMSPEQAKGMRVDHRADIYSVGAILYTTLTGRVPFERDDAAATVVAVLTQEPPRPCSLEPSIPASLEFIIQKAMAREPEDRYQTMRELEDALAPFDPEHQAGPEGALVGAASSTDVRSARPLLGMLVTIALLALLVGLMTAVAGTMRALGMELTPLESTLLLVGVGFGLITPTVLLVRYVRRRAWNNSLKTLAMLRSIRRPLLAAGCVYGFSALLVRLIDNVVLRGEVGVAWPMWDVMLFVGALAAAGITIKLDRGSDAAEGKKANPLTLAVAMAVGVALVAIGPLMFRGDGAEATADNATPSGFSGIKALFAPKAATPEELATATAAGVAEVQALAKKYPKDPLVLTALMKAQAKTQGAMTSAIDTATKLMELKKDARDDTAVHDVLVDALSDSDEARKRSFALMTDEMGSAGPDLLYRVAETKKAYRHRANELLKDDKVRKKASKALLIAIELRDAKGCREALLERAGKEGDERAVKILRPLAGTKLKPCGFMGLQRCKSQACKTSAPRINAAISAIEARGRK